MVLNTDVSDKLMSLLQTLNSFSLLLHFLSVSLFTHILFMLIFNVHIFLLCTCLRDCGFLGAMAGPLNILFALSQLHILFCK